MRHPLPAIALHQHYADSGGHADCYAADIPAPTTLAAFVEAFYTSHLFRLERRVLAMTVGKPSSDAQARAVAMGEAPFDRPGAGGRFAAWSVEERTDSQLVMRDYQSRTRSWFMVLPEEPTRVWFGTAIAASRHGGQIPFAFRALMPLHLLYSRALLRSAVRGLRKTGVAD